MRGVGDSLELATAIGAALTEMAQAGILNEVRIDHRFPGRQPADVRAEIRGEFSLLELVVLLQTRGAL